MADVKPFLSIDLPAFKRGLLRVQTTLDKVPALLNECVARAMAEWLEKLVAEARSRAPMGQGVQMGGTEKGGGTLRESGQVIGPTITPGSIDAQAGFAKNYAAIQDQGGTIRPKTAGALFIPLKPGVHPIKGKEAQKASGWKFGIDFVFAQLVTLKGNRYFTSVLEERLPRAMEDIGALVEKYFVEATAKLPKQSTPPEA